MSDESFREQIQQCYPEGLTGVFAIGGTRTTYILEKNRHAADPGQISDFPKHAEFLQESYQQLALMFFELGGQNMLISALSFRGFYNRGAEYGELAAQELLRLINDNWCNFYRENNIDPYIVGIDVMLLENPDSSVYKVGQQLHAFRDSWDFQSGRQKLIWDVASIPMYSIWQVFQKMTAEERCEFDKIIHNEHNLETVYQRLYKHFARQVFGTEIPLPHFYLGTNKSGDLKVRSILPFTLTGGEYMRLFYTPYPTLFIRKESLKNLLDDLAFGDRFHSAKTDYSGQYTPELVQQEYERVMALSAQPDAILGLSRRVRSTDHDR